MIEQLKKYWEIAKLALLQEKNTQDSKLKGMNEHEKEFLPAVLEVTETPPSHAALIIMTKTLNLHRKTRAIQR